MKVKVIAELCAGEGICEAECPDVFEVDGDVAVVKCEDVPPELEEQVRNACANCPTEAILIEE